MKMFLAFISVVIISAVLFFFLIIFLYIHDWYEEHKMYSQIEEAEKKISRLREQQNNNQKKLNDNEKEK